MGSSGFENSAASEGAAAGGTAGSGPAREEQGPSPGRAERPGAAGGGGEGEQPVRRRLEAELWALAIAVLVLFSSKTLVDPDLPGHLAYGLEHLRRGELLRADPYSYTAHGAPWVNHEWLFELAAAWLFARAGAWGLWALQASAWVGTGLLCLGAIRRARAAFVPGVVLFLFFSAVCFASITIRPQLCTYLLFAVLLALLEGARRGRTWLLAGVPPLFAAWVNLHGGFLAGLCVLGAVAAGVFLDALLRRPGDGRAPPPVRRALAFAGAGVASAAATLANPYGVGLWAWLARSLGVDRSDRISEWRSVGLDSQSGILVALIVLCAVALGRRWRWVPSAHALVLAGLSLMAVRHLRHGAFVAIAACFCAPGALHALYRRWAAPPPHDLEPGQLARFRILVAALLLPALGGYFLLPGRGLPELRLRADGSSPFPTGAVQYLDAHPEVRGNLLVHFDWAQLVIYRYAPRLRVFFDGRFRTVYPAEVEEDFFAFHRGEQPDAWRRALDRYPTEWVLVEAEAPAAKLLREDPAWRVVYRDAQAVLYGRGPGPEPVVRGEPPESLPFAPP